MIYYVHVVLSFARKSRPLTREHQTLMPEDSYERILLEVCLWTHPPLSSAIPFPVQRTAASRGEEHAPTTSGGRTFWNIPAPRMNQNRSCRRGIVAVGPQPRLSPQSVVIIRADNSSGSAQLNKGLASLRYTQPSSTPRSGTRKRTSSTPAQASMSRRPTHRVLVLYYISAWNIYVYLC